MSDDVSGVVRHFEWGFKNFRMFINFVSFSVGLHRVYLVNHDLLSRLLLLGQSRGWTGKVRTLALITGN